MATIREALKDWGVAHGGDLPLMRRTIARRVLEEGGGPFPNGAGERRGLTRAEMQAWAALADGAGLDDLCPPDPADPVAVLCAELGAPGMEGVLLPQLADALEDAGDPRAAGVRLIGDRRPLFLDWALNDRWAWLEAGTPDSNGASRHRIASKTFALLPADGRGQKGRWRGIRSECFLALAQALTM